LVVCSLEGKNVRIANSLSIEGGAALKTKMLISIIVLLSTICTTVFGDRELDRTEILQIFQTLTSQPRNTWIPAGTIEATHLEYNVSSGYITDSNVIVKYDGDKFYWEININSHTTEKQSQGGSRDDFNLRWNKKRIFVWDGQHYTMYFKSGNNAVVTESPSDMPIRVNGPLTAGIVPWGYGIYTYENLSAAESSAVEMDIDGKKQVHLTLNNTDTPEIVIVLDSNPTKNYPVLLCSISRPDHSSIIKNYGGYTQVSSKWVPTIITIEQYDNSKQIPELLSRDEWNINSISITLNPAEAFSVVYKTDALVEYHSPITDEPLSYRYSNKVDTDSLLQDRIANVLAPETQAQNCATMVMKYVSEQLDRSVTNLQLAELVSELNKGTSLNKLRQFAQSLSFYCLAGKTDIATLKNLKDCQMILHLPGPNHYVVVEHIDDEYVWIIDLDSNKFYYRMKIDIFNLEWSKGTVLLISEEPLNILEGNFTEFSEDQLHEIIGGFPNYSCTNLIQKYNVAF